MLPKAERTEHTICFCGFVPVKNEKFYLGARVDDHHLEEPVTSQFGLKYRQVSEPDHVLGSGVRLTGAEIELQGPKAIEPGASAEVWIDAVRGLAPALLAYIEVDRCEPLKGLHYKITGAIKAIRSQS